jgi:hypothetical protein
MFWAFFRLSPVSYVEAHQPGIDMFQTCRQIYAEASSVFYQNNTFAITRKCTRWNPLHDVNGTFIVLAVPWLKQLGSGLRLIRKLELDLDTLCPKRCSTQTTTRLSFDVHIEGLIDVLPLLSLVWDEDLHFDIRLVQAKHEAYQSCVELHTEYGARSRDYSMPCEALTAALRAFQRDDLDMKRLRRVIAHVGLKRDGSGGAVVFLTNKGNRWTPSRTSTRPKGFMPYLDNIQYFTAKQGQTLRRTSTGPANIFALPYLLRGRIIEYALACNEVQDVAIDTAPAILAAMGPLTLGHDGHDVLQRTLTAYIDSNRFSIVMKSTHANAQFPRFERIGQILSRIFYRKYSLHDRADPWPDMTSWRIQITLAFETKDVATFTKLADVRFDAMPLVQATLKLSLDKPVTISLDVNGAQTSTVLCISKLRHAVLEAWQGDEVKPREDDTRKNCPQVWLDGFGGIVRVVKAAQEEHASLEPTERSAMRQALVDLSTHRDPRFMCPHRYSSALYRFRYLELLCDRPML